jgi:2-amino-4-hydroxy-6-hydroxymethyldihydropteridine diphosphokinase
MQAAEDLRPDRYPVRRASPRGFEQAYVRVGDGGQPLLLVHGWPETSRIWWRNIGPLAEAGFDVIAPDLRGFGLSEAGPDAFGDVVSHSRDLYALLHDELGIERVVAVAGDLGGAVVQDLSQRQPGFIEQLVVFNCPLPYVKGAMDGLRTRRDASVLDYYERQGNDPEGLMAELSTQDRCSAYVASFYTERRWAAAGAFDAATAAFHAEPFADPARLRETFKVYESALHAEHRIERPLWTRNATPTRILFGSADGVMSPDFDRMAAAVFLDHSGPTRVPESGHFLQWEAAELLDEVILEFRESSEPRDCEELAFISLGSNLGSREQQLCAALAALRRTQGVRDVVVSPVYETAPVGPGEQGLYLNAAARVRTRLSPEQLLARLLEIEDAAGRVRGERNAARVLDLDLLLYGERRIDTPSLKVPHPRLHERCFVLDPLAHLAPDLPHPELGESIAKLAARVHDPSAARRRL